MNRGAATRPLIAFAIIINFAVIQGATESFKSKAHLNRDTGIATSCEESRVVFSSLSQKTIDEIACVAKGVIAEYPNFLARASLTLGLLNVHAARGNSQVYVSTSVFPFDLLCFGPPRDSSKAVRTMKAYEYKGAVLCSLEMPILGGLLTQLTERKSSDDVEAGGCLRFTVIRKAVNTSSHSSSIVFVTEIAERYKPSIAGKCYPRSKFRSVMYCATQRRFHKYVMWRFHRVFRKELERYLNSA
ncbi:hypothetical protein HJC23_006708 [Cyclotella cryptica]|uniref:Uncharacterized protein n=1 Tax=Cyclotella cryptica TaxID=29204 RepID=A0ABD3NY25_9STRA